MYHYREVAVPTDRQTDRRTSADKTARSQKTVIKTLSNTPHIITALRYCSGLIWHRNQGLQLRANLKH